MKTILVTGSTDGIGRQTALELALMGNEVIVHGKNKDRGREVVDNIKRLSNNDAVHYLNANFTDFNEIQKLADAIKSSFPKLDILINNAGVFENGKNILPNGLEKTFMVNHMAAFALTLQLLDMLKASEEGRIVNVSSMAQASTIDFDNLNGEKYYDDYNAYALSKLENVLFTYKLARQLDLSGITVNCLHPGVISTKLLHKGWGSGGATLEAGAKTSVFAATSASLTGKHGFYFVNSEERRSSAISYDKKIQERLWEISLELSKLNDPFS